MPGKYEGRDGVQIYMFPLVSNSKQFVLNEEVGLHCHGQGEFSHYGTILGVEHVIFRFVTVVTVGICTQLAQLEMPEPVGNCCKVTPTNLNEQLIKESIFIQKEGAFFFCRTRESI